MSPVLTYHQVVEKLSAHRHELLRRRAASPENLKITPRKAKVMDLPWPGHGVTILGFTFTQDCPYCGSTSGKRDSDGRCHHCGSDPWHTAIELDMLSVPVGDYFRYQLIQKRQFWGYE